MPVSVHVGMTMLLRSFANSVTIMPKSKIGLTIAFMSYGFLLSTRRTTDVNARGYELPLQISTLVTKLVYLVH